MMARLIEGFLCFMVFAVRRQVVSDFSVSKDLTFLPLLGACCLVARIELLRFTPFKGGAWSDIVDSDGSMLINFLCYPGYV
jgi:hypothetical protein